MTKLVKILFNSSCFTVKNYFNNLFNDLMLDTSNENQPTWQGKLSKNLNLSNQIITIEDFISLAQYNHPQNKLSLPITFKISPNTTTIFDFILTAPKSLSLLDSLFPNMYAPIHHNAVNKAVEIIEDFAKVNIPNFYRNKSIEIITQKIATTQFFHKIGYNNEVNLHTHVIILNLLLSIENTYRLWNSKYFMEVLHNASLVYFNEIAKGLLEKNLLFKITQTPWHECTSIELAGIPASLIDKTIAFEKKLFNNIPYYKNTKIKEIFVEDYLKITSTLPPKKSLTIQELYLLQTKSFSLSIAKKLLAIHKKTLTTKLVTNHKENPTSVITSPIEMAKIIDQYAELIFRREVLYSFDFYIYCFFIFYFPGQVSFEVLHNGITLSTKLMHITFNGIQSIVVTKKFYKQSVNIFNSVKAIGKSNPQYLVNTLPLTSSTFLDSLKDIYTNSLPQNIITCSEKILQNPIFLTVVTNVNNESFSLLILAIAKVRKLTNQLAPTFLISKDKIYSHIYKDLLTVLNLDFNNLHQYQFPDNSLLFIDPSILKNPYECLSFVNYCSKMPNIRLVFCQFYKEITPYINSLWYYIKSIPNTQTINYSNDKNPSTIYSNENALTLDKSKLNSYFHFYSIQEMYQNNLIKVSLTFLEDAANSYVETLQKNLDNLAKTCVICNSTKEQKILNNLIQNKLDSLGILSQISMLHNRSNKDYSTNQTNTSNPNINDDLFSNKYRLGQTFIKAKVSTKVLNNENYLTTNKTIFITKNISNFSEKFQVLTIESSNSKRIFFTNNTDCLKSRLLGKYLVGKLENYYYQPGDLLINLFPLESPLGNIPCGSQFIAMKENNCYKYLDPAWPNIGRIVEVNAPIFTLGYALSKENLYNLKFDKTIVAITSLDDNLYKQLKKRTINLLLFYTPNYLKFLDNLDNLSKEEKASLESITKLLAFDNEDFELLDRPLVLINLILANKKQRKLIEQITFGITQPN